MVVWFVSYRIRKIAQRSVHACGPNRLENPSTHSPAGATSPGSADQVIIKTKVHTAETARRSNLFGRKFLMMMLIGVKVRLIVRMDGSLVPKE